MSQLSTQESAELLLLLNNVDLAHYPQLRRVQGRLQAQESKSVITESPPPPPASSTLSAPPGPPDPPDPESESPQELSQPEYKLTAKDDEFCRALNKLRRDRTQILYGLAILNNLGPYIVMDDSMLDRIAECARAHKLASLDDLYRETWWHETSELGEQVLELVSQYYPRPRAIEAFSPTPSQAVSGDESTEMS